MIREFTQRDSRFPLSAGKRAGVRAGVTLTLADITFLTVNKRG